MIRESIRERLKTYDFLGGLQDSKTRWATSTHYVQRIRLGAAGYAGCLAFALTAGWDMAKDWGRTHVPEWVLKARHRWRSRRPPQPGRQAPEEMVGR